MKWTKEHTDEMKEKVKSVLVRKPYASQYELARVLSIDKKTALKLKKQVVKDNTKRVSDQKVDEEIGRLEAKLGHLALECWQIITLETKKMKTITKEGLAIEVEISIPIKDKLNAIKILVEAEAKLFHIKFDAGVFKRKLGEIEIGKTLSKEEKDLIQKVIDLDYGKSEEPKPDTEAGEPEGSSATTG